MRSLPLLAFLAVSAFAQTPPAAPSLQNLVQNSPFGSAITAGQAAAAAGPLEFRGTFVDRGERFFSILDTGARRAEWVGLKEGGHPYTVKNYDPDSETVTLDYQGRSMSLKLRTARITAMAAQPVAATPQPNVVVAAGTSVGPGVTPGPNTTEAQRLAQVAEEIRRRRALRQQAQGQQNVPPPPNQPPR